MSAVHEAISNTSPLQYLYQSGVLHLLPALYSTVIVPESVVRELADGRARGILLPDPNALPWAKVERPRETSLLRLVTTLGAGEREAIALALEKPGTVLLLDDNFARRHARLMGINLSGTLGVLLKAKQKGLVEIVTPILDRLQDLRFRLDANTRAAVLRLAGERQ
jgi:predicted nucleic acid-binding protein